MQPTSAMAKHLESNDRIRSTPFAPWPFFADDEVAAADRVLRSGKVNYWTGDEGREFEREFAAYHGRKHAVALANGSVALDLALHVLNIGPGDEVIVTSRTFVASAFCAMLRGARPVFADVDRDSQNVTAESIRPLITSRTKALLLVHLAGWPCDMDPILELARQNKLFVIEDCAQAHGATYKGKKIGSFGEIAAFSFCQDKIMTTAGEGGMILTDDDDLWSRSWSFKDHGKSYDAVYNREHAPGFRWLHESPGTNWRLTEIQSAIGRVQLRKLDSWIERRRHHAQLLRDGMSRIPSLRVPWPSPEIHHSFYKFYAFVRPEKLRPGWDRTRIQEAIQAEGIPCFSGSCSEIYLEKAFPPELRPAKRLPVAQELGETSLMFLVHPTLGEADMRDTCEAVAKVLSAASLD